MVVKVDYDKCVQCFACVGTCPVEALSEEDKGPIVDEEKCEDCGSCVAVCPASAMSL